MTMRVNCPLVPSVLALCGLALGACQSDKHTMTDPTTGKAIVCQECYDAVTAARRDQPAPKASRTQVLRTYQCPCCRTEMSVYIQNGTHMVKCGGCARDGIAWDKCLPANSTTK